MVLLSWQLTILTLILMPLFVVVQLRVGRRRQRLAGETQESLSEMTAITEEALSVSGILLAKVFNRVDAEVERYREANREQTRLQVEQAMTGRTFFAAGADVLRDHARADLPGRRLHDDRSRSAAATRSPPARWWRSRRCRPGCRCRCCS